MKRIHITRKGPLTFDKTRRYAVNRDRMLFKPAGLWYGIDDAWKEWCESESMDWIGGETYEVSLGKSNMLVLNTVNDIRQFTEEYN
jgi:hypothetical protein